MWGHLRAWRAPGFVVLLSAAAGLAIHASGALSWLELKTVDARFSIRGERRPPANVVVVGVDNASYGRLPRYPFPRRIPARAIDNLHAAGARLIAYDVGFDVATDTADDLSLYDAARRAAPVVFGTTLITPSGATQVLGGDENLRKIGARAGAADFPLERDGVLRRPLGQIHHLPSIASAVVADLGLPAARASTVSRAYIDFHGPPGTIPSVPFWRVVANQFDPRAVRGKVVVVGLTAPILGDVHQTAAGGGPMPGPEIQAEAISTALRGYPLRDVPPVATTLIILFAALLVPLLDVAFGGLVAAFGAAAAFAAWTVGAQLTFGAGEVVDYTSASLALLLSAAGVMTIEAIADTRERRRLRSLFAAGAPDIVDRVLRAPTGEAVGPTGIIAGYRIEEQIGRGGMGVVYRATQLALDRPVAIKLISSDRSDDPVFQERFKRESRLAAAIEHPNVVPVFEAGEDDGLLFIAMRYVDGIDLGCYLRQAGTLPLEITARLITQLASALDAAHALGLVHRDVKPANVLLTADAEPHAYLTDFGVAKSVESQTGITRGDALVGTIDYMAPENIRGEPADHRADIYSLTALLYHCLTGEPPYPRDREAAILWAHLSATPPVPSKLRPELPVALDLVVSTGLAKLAPARYARAGDLAKAVVVSLANPDRLAAAGGDHTPAAPGHPRRHDGPTIAEAQP